MTNKEVIQLFANYAPMLLVEAMDNLYCLGWNDGIHGNGTMDELTEDWLNGAYDLGLWREDDITATLKLKGGTVNEKNC